MNFIKPFNTFSTLSLTFTLLFCFDILPLNSKLVNSQSTEPSRAECYSQEAQITSGCNSSKPTTELIVDNSNDNCCKAKGYYKCLKKLVKTGVECEMFIRDRIDEYEELLDKYDCDDVRC